MEILVALPLWIIIGYLNALFFEVVYILFQGVELDPEHRQCSSWSSILLWPVITIIGVLAIIEEVSRRVGFFNGKDLLEKPLIIIHKLLTKEKKND